MSKNSEAAAAFVPGQAVTFQTAGRGGVGPVRNGTVDAVQGIGTRGVWVSIREDGAVEGLVVKTRASLVKAR